MEEKQETLMAICFKAMLANNQARATFQGGEIHRRKLSEAIEEYGRQNGTDSVIRLAVAAFSCGPIVIKQDEEALKSMNVIGTELENIQRSILRQNGEAERQRRAMKNESMQMAEYLAELQEARERGGGFMVTANSLFPKLQESLNRLNQIVVGPDTNKQ